MSCLWLLAVFYIRFAAVYEEPSLCVVEKFCGRWNEYEIHILSDNEVCHIFNQRHLSVVHVAMVLLV